jgi:sulfate permease, SulP family
VFPALTVTLALTTGLLALTIIVGQIPKLLGVSKGEGDFFRELWHLISHLGQA